MNRPGQRPPPSRPGLRREVSLVVPLSLVVLVALVAFTLLSYHGAVQGLVDERQGEALRVARAAAGELAAAGSPATVLSDTRRYSAVEGAYLAARDGDLVAQSGEALPGELLDPFPDDGEDPESGAVVGPSAATGGRVVAVVPAIVSGQPHLLRVDLAAPGLASQRRGLAVLTWVVTLAGAGVVLLLVLFLRQLLAPYDDLVARAREVSAAAGREEVAGEDDVELLVRTFERGVAALAASRGATSGTAGPGAGDTDLEALQRTLAASLESGVLLLDAGGRVVAINAAGSQMLGVGEPVPGTALGELLGRHPELAALLRDAIAEGKAVQRREVELEPGGRRPPGEVAAPGGDAAVPPLHLGLSLHPLRRDGDEIRGYLVLFADLTETRRRGEQARLEESLARLGELAAGVAHELRNSLATMRGYLTLMERSPEEPATTYLAEVRREADQLQRVLEDFLSFARPGSARLEEVSLVAIAERAAADPALAASGGAAGDGEAAAPVEVTAAPGTPILNGDPGMLERAVRNLLSNAWEAQRQAGERAPVQVRVGPAPAGDEAAGGVELVVEDRGDGVPQELAGRLFTPFVTGRPGGIGLGLALSHRIVAFHGGTLRLEPRPGGGTRARVVFPPNHPGPRRED